MFQYAAGRSLALRLGADLKMDRSYLDGTQMGNTPRRYELGSFDVVERFADRAEVAKWTARGETRFRTLLLRLLGAAGIRRPHPRVLRDPDFRFQPEFLSVSGDVYLEGYWQSERYFASVSDVIRREFSARNPLRGRDDELARTLEAENAVSVHVRRGDFVRRPETYEFHGVCGVEYYRRCMEIVSGSVVDPHFVVFTDEPGWARENLPPARRVTFVDWDAPRPGWVDLELMRRCRHHIVANSSFSWWGAWLCGNPGKRVLAPARWFNRPGMDTRDLLPASWTVV
jgi:hypothetical protein